MAELQPDEAGFESQEQKEVRRVRRVIADTYTFIRSQEINRTLASFTFDHYIEEAKRQIKGDGRAIRNAAGEAFDIRPTKLAALTSLEDEFRATLEAAKVMAKAADAIGDEEDDEEDE